jgi:succinoglycan biosynthesis protein ExoA
VADDLVGGRPSWPSVSVVVPVLDVSEQIGACLEAIGAQRYGGVIEVLVVDGGSSDATAAIAARRPGVTVLHNPRRSRPAGMNVGIAAARGEVVVRVDARTVLAPDYVQRCVEALERSGAAMVGGPMRLSGGTPAERGIAAAMSSRLGGGTARFRRPDPQPGFTDTVYLGAFRRDVIVALGGYDEGFGGNEDAELAWRASRRGGVYLDPAIRSSYAVRGSLSELFAQYRRYGTSRSGTICKHPRSLSVRQLAVPALLVGMLSPWRRWVLALYACAVLGRGAAVAASDPEAAVSFVAAVPVMHLGWAVGLCRGMRRAGAQRAGARGAGAGRNEPAGPRGAEERAA